MPESEKSRFQYEATARPSHFSATPGEPLAPSHRHPTPPRKPFLPPPHPQALAHQ